MKKLLFCTLAFWAVFIFCAIPVEGQEAEGLASSEEVSYAFGMLIASDLMDSGLKFDYDAFIQGFRALMENEETRYTLGEAVEKIKAAYEAAQAEIAEQNTILGKAFLSENSKRPGVSVTPSGLQYEVISEGRGEHPGPEDFVLVHYRGTTIDGNEFDSTYEGGRPVEIPLDRVIPGWSEGLRLMKEGEKAKLFIPPGLAYGASGAGEIGPNSVIIFEVELLAILRPTSEEE